MIEIKNLSKSYGNVKSVNSLFANVKNGCIFGLVGSNGSGKSTLLRMIAGILAADEGEILADGENVWENPEAKSKLFYLSDDHFFFPHSTIRENAAYLSSVYPRFDRKRAEELAGQFGLPSARKINTFSKGMQKQASVVLGLAAHPDYLLCDETFDGLDPVIRQLVKRLIAAEVAERNMTVVLASHNLRELEDICDHLALLHKGEMLFESEIDTLKDNVRTVQARFESMPERLEYEGLRFGQPSVRGTMLSCVVSGDEELCRSFFENAGADFYEFIPLTLEEIFITEMEEKGYDAKHLIG